MKGPPEYIGKTIYVIFSSQDIIKKLSTGGPNFAVNETWLTWLTSYCYIQ